MFKDQLKTAIVNLVVNGNSDQYIIINDEREYSINLNLDNTKLKAEIDLGSNITINVVLCWWLSNESNFDIESDNAINEIIEKLDYVIHACKFTKASIKS